MADSTVDQTGMAGDATLSQLRALFAAQPVLVVGGGGLLGALVLSLYTTRLLHVLACVAIGFALGCIATAPEATPAELLLRWKTRRRNSALSSATTAALSPSSSSPVRLLPHSDGSATVEGMLAELPDDVQQGVDGVIEWVVRDYIRFWYAPLNLSRSPDFEAAVRAALGGVAMNLAHYLRHVRSKDEDFAAFLTYGVANALIAHIREYRHALNGRSAYYDRQAKDDDMFPRLRAIGEVLLARLLPRQDASNLACMTLLTEIMGTTVLWKTVCALSRPSTLNSIILAAIHGRLQPAHDTTQQHQHQHHSPTATTPNTATKTSFVSHPTSPSMKEALPPPDSIKTILQTTTYFTYFMDYLDALNAPPYLRFYTNADIFRQLASLNSQPDTLSSGKNNQPNPIKQDAMELFRLHFSEKGDMRIPLFDPNRDKTEEQRMIRHDVIVQRLRDRIDNDPSPHCFREAVDYVEKVLEGVYMPGFMKKGRWRGDTLKPHDTEDELSDSASNHSIGGLTASTSDLAADAAVSDLSLRPMDSRPTTGDMMPDSPIRVATFGSIGNYSASAPNLIRVEPPSPLPRPSDLSDIGEAYLDEDSDGSESHDHVLSATPSDRHSTSSVESMASRNPLGSDDPMLHLAAAITSLREQLMHVSLSIEDAKKKNSATRSRSVAEHAALRRLIKTRKDLEKQLSQLLKIAAETDGAGSSNTSSEATKRRPSFDKEPGGGEPVDVHGIEVRVSYVGGAKSMDEITEDKPPPTTTTTNLLSTDFSTAFSVFSKKITNVAAGSALSGAVNLMTRSNQQKDMVFLIEVERTGSTSDKMALSKATGWLITRRYEEFSKLHQALSAQFQKVSKIMLPTYRSQRRPSLSNDPKVRQKEAAGILARDLQNYLQMLLCDKLLCDSRILQSFFRPDIRRPPSKSTTALPSSMSTQPVKNPLPKPLIGFLSRPKKSTDEDSPTTPTSKTPTFSAETLLSNSTLTIPMLIDTAFALLTTIFHTTHWVRVRALSALRGVLVRASGDMPLNTILPPINIAPWLVWFREYMDAKSSSPPPPPPSQPSQTNPATANEEEERMNEETRDAVYQFLNHLENSPGQVGIVVVYLVRMVGRTTMEDGIERLLNMVHDEKWNRILWVNVLEVLVKSVFGDDRGRVC